MQAFGRSPALQAQKIKETTERSQQLGGLVATMLRPSPKDRISASGLVQRLAAGEEEGLARANESSTIRGTQRGRMLQKVERADEMAEEIAELKRSLAAQDAELKAEREKREAERAEHTVGLAGAVAKVEAKSEKLIEAERCEHATSLASVREKFETKIEQLETKIEKFEEKLGY